MESSYNKKRTHKPRRHRSRSQSPKRKTNRLRSVERQRNHSRSRSPPRRSPRRHQPTSQSRNQEQEQLRNRRVSPSPLREEHPSNDNPAAPVQRNLKTSGLLQEEYSSYKGVVIKYNEPPEACKPTVRWRMYIFKPGCEPEKFYIHRQSAYLISRDRKIADIPFDHPSISKQHAVLQYRKTGGVVKPYIMDLESSNCTYLNGQKIEPRRFYEVLEKDVVKFGYSSRECVFIPENLV